MNNRAFTVSFAAAFFAVVFVHMYVTSTIDTARKDFGENVPVVVAKKNIRELDMLDETNLTLRPMPKNFVQPGTSSRIEDFKGALAIAPVMAEEQLTRTKITVAGVRPGLARQIASGKRAVTIRINDETGVAKLLKPGDRVDVAATIDPTGSGNKVFFETRVILQDKLVLATGKYVTNSVPGILEVDPYKGETKNRVPLSEYTQYSTVTLEVDATQLTTLIFAASNMNIYLALRSNDDITHEDIPKAMLKDFVTTVPPAQGKGPPAGK